jgi:hypothetical protein
MRRCARFLSAALLAMASPAATQAQTPPHAWLFGSWTGGLFPVSTQLSAQACLAQPVIIFTRDVVLRASLTEPTYAQRLVVTARTDPGSTEFRFTPVPQSTNSDLLGVAAQDQKGFGCESPDVLHVQRHTDNEISFPGCSDFPYPLVRCPAK